MTSSSSSLSLCAAVTVACAVSLLLFVAVTSRLPESVAWGDDDVVIVPLADCESADFDLVSCGDKTGGEDGGEDGGESDDVMDAPPSLP